MERRRKIVVEPPQAALQASAKGAASKNTDGGMLTAFHPQYRLIVGELKSTVLGHRELWLSILPGQSDAQRMNITPRDAITFVIGIEACRRWFFSRTRQQSWRNANNQVKHAKLRSITPVLRSERRKLTNHAVHRLRAMVALGFCLRCGCEWYSAQCCNELWPALRRFGPGYTLAMLDNIRHRLRREACSLGTRDVVVADARRVFEALSELVFFSGMKYRVSAAELYRL